MTKTPMGIAAKDLAASDDETLFGARLRADCAQAGVQAPENGNRPAAGHAFASHARSGQCLDLTHSFYLLPSVAKFTSFARSTVQLPFSEVRHSGLQVLGRRKLGWHTGPIDSRAASRTEWRMFSHGCANYAGMRKHAQWIPNYLILGAFYAKPYPEPPLLPTYQNG
jgi:hypothetical protein